MESGTGKPVPYESCDRYIVGDGLAHPAIFDRLNYWTGAPQYSQQPFSSGVVVAPQ